MSNAIRCIDHRFAFKNSGIACLALIFNLSYLRSTILHPKNQCETVQVLWQFIYHFFRAIDTNQWLSGQGWSLIVWWYGFGFCKVWNPSAVPQPFCVALSPSVHWDTRFLYCCALNIFLLLGFRQWRSRADKVLTLDMNIRLPLFWSTWSPAQGPDSATCAGLAHGCD